MNYYNEIDPFAAQWLRNLIAAGLIPDGVVDERSICDVQPDDIREYTQCHFFAGIAGWPEALRLAGWPADRPAWTGSCPCQPFSVAGKGGGTDDERHLWPEFHRLIRECRPPTVIGEQVASPDALKWCDAVQADLEREAYAFGVADLCAAGIGAPHIRQRLFWAGVAEERLVNPIQPGLEGHPGDGHDRNQSGRERTAEAGPAAETGGTGGLADANGREFGGITDGQGSQPSREAGGWQQGDGIPAASGELRWLAESDSDGRESGQSAAPGTRHRDSAESDGSDGGVESRGRTSPLHGPWRDADWLFCRDGKWRPVESGTFPMAHGIPGRVGQLRAYGNAIVVPLAAEFVKSLTEIQ